MAINSIGSSTSLLGQSVLNIKNQLNSLQVQLASGEKSTTYSGMGTGEGFAIAARAQLANITGYQNTITNVGTTISAANTALQSLATSSEQRRDRGQQRFADPEQQRPDGGAGDGDLAAVVDAVGSQYPGRQRIYFLGRCHQYAFGGERRRNSQRQWRPGRIDAGHQRAPAGRSRHRPGPRPSHAFEHEHDHAAHHHGLGGAGQLAVRHEVERRQLDTDGRDGDGPDRLAAGDIGQSRRPPIPIRAIS